MITQPSRNGRRPGFAEQRSLERRCLDPLSDRILKGSVRIGRVETALEALILKSEKARCILR